MILNFGMRMKHIKYSIILNYIQYYTYMKFNTIINKQMEIRYLIINSFNLINNKNFTNDLFVRNDSKFNYKTNTTRLNNYEI